ELAEQGESLLGRTLRHALLEEVAFDGRGEPESVKAPTATVREEPLRALEAHRLAPATQDEALLANAVRGAVFDHHGDGPHLARRLGAGVGEIAFLPELELAAAVAVPCAV